MKRRNLLAAGSVGMAVGVSGCLADARDVLSDDGSTTKTREDNTEESRKPPSDPGEPAEEESIGENDEDPLHRLRVWNTGAEQRDVGVEIEHGGDPVEGEYAIDSEEYVVFELRERGRYFITITVDGEEPGDAEAFPYELERDWFDEPCPGTEMYVGDGQGFEATTVPDGGDCP